MIAQRGIKQGAKDAPLLWTLTMILILVDLQARYSLAWLRDHIVVYVDDIHLRWVFKSHQQVIEALSDLQHILTVLQAFGFKINMTKSVVMFRVIGREAPTLLRKWVLRPNYWPCAGPSRTAMAPANDVENSVPRSDNKSPCLGF